jgi:hypothetical protein
VKVVGDFVGASGDFFDAFVHFFDVVGYCYEAG